MGRWSARKEAWSTGDRTTLRQAGNSQAPAYRAAVQRQTCAKSFREISKLLGRVRRLSVPGSWLKHGPPSWPSSEGCRANACIAKQPLCQTLCPWAAAAGGCEPTLKSDWCQVRNVLCIAMCAAPKAAVRLLQLQCKRQRSVADARTWRLVRLQISCGIGSSLQNLCLVSCGTAPDGHPLTTCTAVKL